MATPPITGKRSFEPTSPQPLRPETKRRRTRENHRPTLTASATPHPPSFHGLSSKQIADMLGVLSSTQLPTALPLIQPEDLKEKYSQQNPNRKREILGLIGPEILKEILNDIPKIEFLDVVRRNIIDKNVLVTVLDDYWHFGCFLDTLQFPQDNGVVERMCEQQYEWAFDWIPLDNIPPFIDALPDDYIEEQTGKLEPLLGDTERQVSFTHSQVALAYVRSSDLPDALVPYVEQFTERQLGLAVLLCPEDKIADLYTQFSSNEVTSRIIQLIPLMSNAKVAALANLTFVPSMLSLLTNGQLIACIPYIEVSLLKKNLPFMTLEQLSTCARTISEQKRKLLTKTLYDNFRFPTEDHARAFENFDWWRIGLAITVNNRYETLKHHFEDMSPFQFETALRCMTTTQKTSVYFSLPERLQARLVQLLIPRDMTEIEENADQILPKLLEKTTLYQEKLESTQETLEEIESTLGLLEKDQDCSDDLTSQTHDLTSKLTRNEREILVIHQKLKSAIESSTLYRDYFQSIRLETPKSEHLRVTFCTYNEQTQQLLTKITTDLKIRLERIRSRISAVESDSSQALDGSVLADRDQIMRMYLDAREVIQEAGINEEELDDHEISWDDLVKAGLTSYDVFVARGIYDILSLKRSLGV